MVRQMGMLRSTLLARVKSCDSLIKKVTFRFKFRPFFKELQAKMNWLRTLVNTLSMATIVCSLPFPSTYTSTMG